MFMRVGQLAMTRELTPASWEGQEIGHTRDWPQKRWATQEIGYLILGGKHYNASVSTQSEVGHTKNA